MRSSSWKNFWAVILVVAGLQLNLTERLYVFDVVEPFKTLLFLFLMSVTIAGIVCKKDLIKDLALMAVILILMGYLGIKFPIDGYVEKIPLVIRRIASIIFIANGVVILTDTVRVLGKNVENKIQEKIQLRKIKKDKKDKKRK